MDGFDISDRQIDVTGRADATAGELRLRLRILATSDLHAHLCAWDYFNDRPSPRFGLERTAALIAEARSEEPNTLLFDNGDFLQGSPLGDCFAAKDASGEDQPVGDEQIWDEPDHPPHPMIDAMNALRYDAITLGNHEFSHGLDFLIGALEGAEFPVVSSNIALKLGATPAEDQPLVARHVMLRRSFRDTMGRLVPLKIGVLGVCPPQVMVWERDRIGGRLAVRDMVEAAVAAAEELRAAGADVVLALSHSGILPLSRDDARENVSLVLAERADVDAVIMGHVHQTFPDARQPAQPGVDPLRGTLAGKPAVMPGFFGSHLGVIDLDLALAAGGGWRVAGHHSALRPIFSQRGATAPAVTDRALAARTAAAHRETLRWAHQVIGHTPVPLDTHFALLGDSAALRIVAGAQRNHVARRLSRSPHAELPVLSAVAPFKAGGRGGPDNYTDIAAGPLAMRHAVELYLHPNSLVALRVTGDELRRWLERAVRIFHRIRPGARDVPLIDDDCPSFNFDTIDGLSWQIDLTRPVLEEGDEGPGRIVDLCWQGRPLDPAAEFILATNSFRAAGGGGFPATGPGARVVLTEERPIRDILIEHIAGGGIADVATPSAWGFAPVPGGASVLFDSGPGSFAQMARIDDLKPEDMGPSPESGFRRFRLWL